MSYVLKHTAEAIDYKLNLIDKNKNFLQYPYTETLPDGFEDVGDGSILTYAPAGATETRFLLTTCALPAGNYFISLDITNMLEEVVTTVSGFSLSITTGDDLALAVAFANDASYPGSPSVGSDRLGLEVETSIKVYLNVPTSFDTGLLIKPQIEEGEEKTDWVPNMDKIGTYVDRRFNSTSTKIAKVVNDTAERFTSTNIKIDEISDDVDTRFDAVNTKFDAVIKSNAIKVGSTELTEAQVIKILNFIDTIE